jgi:hypothetical protein
MTDIKSELHLGHFKRPFPQPHRPIAIAPLLYRFVEENVSNNKSLLAEFSA